MVSCGSMGRYCCCVPVCKNQSGRVVRILSWHSFPKDYERKLRWIVAIRRDVGKNFQITKNTKVCSEHFTAEDFKPLLHTKQKYLKPDAIPSVFSFGHKVSKQPRGSKPLEKKRNGKKKGEQPRVGPRKILRPLKEHRKLELLLAKNSSISEVNASLTSAIFPSSVQSKEVKRTITVKRLETKTKPYAIPIDKIKTEPLEEDEILGPLLENLLDPTLDNDPKVVTDIKIKEEPPDEVPNFESFGLLEPAIEMIFEESAPNGTEADYPEGTEIFKVKAEINDV